MKTYDVRIWKIEPVVGKRTTSYRLRWRVATEKHSKTFSRRALADSFRSTLVKAASNGEPFDTVTGLPESLARQQNSRTWLDHAMAYVEMKWPRASAKHRTSIAESLAVVTPVLVGSDRGMPTKAVIRKALYGWAFDMGARKQEPDKEGAAAIAWLRKASLRVTDLDEPAVIRKALDALALKLDGKPAAASTVRRKRATFYNCLRYAVELRLLPANPIDVIQWKAPEQEEQVDPRVVVNAAQAKRVITAVRGAGPTGERLETFFGCLYYGGTRPGEAMALREEDCLLPLKGWGALTLSRSEARAGSRWTDDGGVRDQRGLKHRPRQATRIVPIPPLLVAMLRRHISKYGVGPDGRLFRTQKGRSVSESVYGPLWQRARTAALTSTEERSMLAKRPYDLRHAAVSLWLNAGVPVTEVAARAGHSVAVLLKVYAKCLDGQAQEANARIEAALAA